MSSWQIIGAIAVLLILILVGVTIYTITIYNGLVALKNNIDKSWSNIDVLLKQRFDEVPKLVKICERYMKHEAETLEKVTKARAMMSSTTSIQKRAAMEGMLTDALKSLFAVSEAYPELRADKQFGALQVRISQLEDEIADRRELYNDSVTLHNIRIEQVPDVLLARPLGYSKKELWRIKPGERQDPGIKFSE